MRRYRHPGLYDEGKIRLSILCQRRWHANNNCFGGFNQTKIRRRYKFAGPNQVLDSGMIDLVNITSSVVKLFPLVRVYIYSEHVRARTRWNSLTTDEVI